MKTILLPGTLLMLALSGSVYAEEDNVHFSGALVAEPCTLPEADTDIQLDFGSVVEKYLYKYQRTKSQPFSIHLTECNPTILSSVSVTFQGTADIELINMLALDASSSAKGVAIGLELADGTPLEINKASPFTALTNGSNTLTFNAFVQAQPTILANKTLVAGDFTAISSFVLAYQ
ncbi:fimbrial protein [Cronobacter dublinensis]|uniref:Type 1 fimbrial protein n=1 Tax=Cronobacter dublinensis TaxID=413497 RepID=A0A9Q4XJK8_9ENTR|nr:fimbrial protein [Cronobacter dublinensis]EKK7713900.1 type 1 fimbrial protein [Cronobacter dublinensis]ELY2853826.1 type 1 fimbrial protein [Cronobacter dublinensis]NCH87173.1 type 1 fimbrial protein [Cronobacter dublinensis]